MFNKKSTILFLFPIALALVYNEFLVYYLVLGRVSSLHIRNAKYNLMITEEENINEFPNVNAVN